VGDCRMWLGRAFQREGAATEKALSPQVRSLVLGTKQNRCVHACVYVFVINSVSQYWTCIICVAQLCLIVSKTVRGTLQTAYI